MTTHFSFRAVALSIILSGVLFASCKESEPTTPAVVSLYDQVGGTTMVSDPAMPGTMIEKGRLTLRNVVDSSIFVIAADSRMTAFFPALLGEVSKGDLTGFSRLSKNFTDFLCVATGSKNYSYSGMNMVAAHNPSTNSRMGMKVSSADFDAFVADIGVGLAKNGVNTTTNAKLVNDLVALLNTTRADIVQK